MVDYFLTENITLPFDKDAIQNANREELADYLKKLIIVIQDIYFRISFSVNIGCKIATGTYDGDGATSQAITGLGFQPKYVKIWKHPGSEGDIEIFEKLDQTWGDYAVAHTVAATDEHYVYDNRISSLDSNGFTVDDDGADSNPNANGVTYDYLALG
jgi:hypothetical protein